MRKSAIVVKLGLFAVALGAFFAVEALAAKPGGGGGGGGGSKCPRDILCPDVMAPVICSDGQTYSNACYAYQQCATDCVPTGDV